MEDDIVDVDDIFTGFACFVAYEDLYFLFVVLLAEDYLDHRQVKGVMVEADEGILMDVDDLVVEVLDELVKEVEILVVGKDY